VRRRIGLGLLVSLLISISSSVVANQSAFNTCPQISDDISRLAWHDSFAEATATERTPLFGFGIDGLTSHEPTKLFARTDSKDESQFYMDATLSVKHPLFTPVVEQVADVLDIDRDTNIPRLYLAFTTRFSQYLGSRQSSPVVPRSYNPELFLRIWRSGGFERTNPSYWDFGYGHESNGQRINNKLAFDNAITQAETNNDPLSSIRERISRGWDYLSVDWNKEWNTPFLPSLTGRTITHIEYRHYLDHGLFQGAPEEYNDWEGAGQHRRPRDRYDGLHFSLQYDLVGEPCLAWVCFERVELSHDTGYAKPFEHNTTSLEVTTSVAGLPVYLWGRTGYNNNLVDYHNYSNSWGVGIEFQR